MMEKVEKMKSKGNFDKSELAKMGIDLNNYDIEEEPEKDFCVLDDGSSTVRSHDDRLYDARAGVGNFENMSNQNKLNIEMSTRDKMAS
jgi:hypothetical protein